MLGGGAVTLSTVIHIPEPNELINHHMRTFQTTDANKIPPRDNLPSCRSKLNSEGSNTIPEQPQHATGSIYHII